ncbi:MAG: hypothetical protein HXY24_17795, partial [Rubrivivax sp.]|nr:hypothetical protein [Rubrivivax sp.]
MNSPLNRMLDPLVLATAALALVCAGPARPAGLFPSCPPPATTVDVVDVSAVPKDLRLSLTML